MRGFQPVSYAVKYRRSARGDGGRVQFTHRFLTEEETFFALAHPYAYSDVQRLLCRVERALVPRGALPSGPDRAPPFLAHGDAAPFERLMPVAERLEAVSPAVKRAAGRGGGAIDDDDDESGSDGDGDADEGEEPAHGGGPGPAGGRGLPARSQSVGGRPSVSRGWPRPGPSEDGGSDGDAGGEGVSGWGSSPEGPPSDDGDDSDGGGGGGGHALGGVYFRRQLLCRSRDGLRVDLVTISAPPSEQDLADGPEDPPPGPHLFPDRAAEPPVLAFPRKRVLFFSARVHPGETPATFMMNGVLQFLVSRDPRARALRDQFVVKLVPCLNPDGVRRGHYRQDGLGNNLNRCYQDPSPEHHPPIHAVREALMRWSSEGRLCFCLDLHAHANKRGVFAYGNHMPEDPAGQLEGYAYARLASMNCPQFDLGGCVFSERNMGARDRGGDTKEGSGRVALYRATGLGHIYTVESHYSAAGLLSTTPHAPLGHAGELLHRPLSPGLRSSATRQTLGPRELRDVGRALAVSALDLLGSNPCSRLPVSEFGGLPGLREWLAQAAAMVHSHKGGRASALFATPLPPYPRRRTRLPAAGPADGGGRPAGAGGRGAPAPLSQRRLASYASVPARIDTGLAAGGEPGAERPRGPAGRGGGRGGGARGRAGGRRGRAAGAAGRGARGEEPGEAAPLRQLPLGRRAVDSLGPGPLAREDSRAGRPGADGPAGRPSRIPRFAAGAAGAAPARAPAGGQPGRRVPGSRIPAFGGGGAPDDAASATGGVDGGARARHAGPYAILGGAGGGGQSVGSHSPESPVAGAPGSVPPASRRPLSHSHSAGSPPALAPAHGRRSLGRGAAAPGAGGAGGPGGWGSPRARAPLARAGGPSPGARGGRPPPPDLDLGLVHWGDGSPPLRVPAAGAAAGPGVAVTVIDRRGGVRG